MNRDDLLARKADLERKLKAREGQPGFSQNVVAIKIRLAEIDKELQAA